MQEVTDPAGSSASALQFTTFNDDIAPLTPTDNPRSQLVTSPGIVTLNQPFWESYEVYLPPSFPVAGTNGGWIALGSPFYGQPFNGTAPVVLSIENGDFRWQANAYWGKPWAILWQTPLVLGQWIRFTWEIDPAVNGFAELYMNGAPVTTDDMGTPTQGLHMPIIDGSNDQGPWFSQLSVYYEHNQFPQLSMYFRDFKIATTQAAAEG